MIQLAALGNSQGMHMLLHSMNPDELMNITNGFEEAYTGKDALTGKSISLEQSYMDAALGTAAFFAASVEDVYASATAGIAKNLTGMFGKIENAIDLNSTEQKFYSKAKLLGNYGYVNPGQLPNEISTTFVGSRYKSYQLLDDIILQRAGTKFKPFGRFFSFDKPVSELGTRIDKAVPPQWPTGGVSPIDTGFAIKIPKGSIVHIGDVANQGNIFVGGTQQVVVQAPWAIPGVKLIDSYQLKEELLWNTIAKKFRK